VEVLKGEKEHTQQKLEKLHAVLEKERSALRDVLSAARKAVDDLKDEKAQVETELEEAKGSVITLEAEVERLLALLKNAESMGVDRTEITIIQNQLFQSNTNIEMHLQTIEQLRLELAAARRDGQGLTGQLESELASLRAQLAAAQRDASASGKLESELASLRAQLAAAQRDASSAGQSEGEMLRLRSELERTRTDREADQKRFNEELMLLRQQLAQAGNNSMDESRHKMQRDKLARECGLRLLNNMFKAKRAERTASALYLWAGTNVKTGGGVSDGPSQDDFDNLKMQMEGQFRRLQLRLSSTRKESGTRWMNQILARWRLHGLVSFLHYWKAIVRQEDALSELEEQKNAELRAQLAQAGRGLKRWMEEREKEEIPGDLEEMKNQEMSNRLATLRKQSAFLVIKEILTRWKMHSVAKALLGFQANFLTKANDTDQLKQMQRSQMAANLTEQALEAERRALEEKLETMKKQLAISEVERRNLEAELQEALQVLEKGMQELKTEKEQMDARLNAERANFLEVMREAENDRKRFQEENASLKLSGGSGDVVEERRQKIEWKREAERTAELFDEKKMQFDLAMRDADFKQQLLRKQLQQSESDCSAAKDELFHSVGDLAHLQNEASSNRKLADTLERRNQQLESLVTRSVVDGRVLSGNLLKQGSNLSTNWHMRFCILDGAALSLYVEKPSSNQEIAKTIIPLMKVNSVQAAPSLKKYAFTVAVKDGTTYAFDCESEENLSQWLSAVEQMMLANKRLTEEWEQIKVGYADDMQLLRDRILVLEQQLTDIKETGVFTANDALKTIQNKYEILEMSLTKMDDDLWLWIDRNMWRSTSVQNMGFGNDVQGAGGSQAQALGGTACTAVTTVEWRSDAGERSEAIINATEQHCFAASDKKMKVYTVNFTAPADSKQVVAVVKVQDAQVFEAPSVPQANTTPEVKKLQRLMTLRNPSPPRSRQEKRGAEKKSPRGKSPPKNRTLNLGSLAAEYS